MNKRQRVVIKLARLNRAAEEISLYKAKKQARKELKSIRTMLINRYGFKK